ncbi:MAG: DDE-type integrase/transposase/recombinase [Thermoplasmata archaeon]
MKERDGIVDIEGILREKGIVLRRRTPLWVMLWSAFLYASGASLRRVRDAIGHRCRRSHVAIWKWIQKFGSSLKDMFSLNGELPSTIVVDETPLMEGRRECYLWVAMDPRNRSIVYVAITQVRNVLVTMSFFKAIKRTYGKYPDLVLTDGGVWYPYTLGRLGMEHRVICGGARSYVERFMETVKDRARPFDKYFPCDLRCDLSHILNWVRLNVMYYNWARPHESLANRPPLGGRRVSSWRMFKSIMIRAMLS